MKKRAILRGLLGFPLGVALGYIITIGCSLALADGAYSPCVPQLVAVMGNEINAVILQAVLCGILGTGFAAGSVIWEMERWSLVKQTGVYFVVISLVMMPIAYFTYWMEHTILGFLGYFGIFALIFVLIWLIEFAVIKHSVKKMNATLKKESDGR